MSSGSFLLDLALGGGWPRGRIVNIVGDASVGKTGLAVEACANFARVGSVRNIRYGEAEAAFDEAYARQLGMPVGVSTPDKPLETVEDFFNDLTRFLKPRMGAQGPCLYVLDSLDALSDAAEMARDLSEGSYGTSKARQLSQLFRRLTQDIAAADCTLFVISQVRANIGVRFGQTQTRSGGKALNFYASQIVWLSQLKQLKRTAMGVERTVGVRIKAIARKNKVGLAYREAELDLIFGYGIDDELSMLDYLHDCKATERLGDKSERQVRTTITRARTDGDRKALAAIRGALEDAVLSHWMEVEGSLAPPMSKYQMRK